MTKTVKNTALVLAMTPFLAFAAGPKKAVATQLRELMERVGQLDQRNQALERRVQELSKAPTESKPAAGTGTFTPAPSLRLDQIEQRQQVLQQQVQALARPVDSAPESIDSGLKLSGNLTAVMQSANPGASTNGMRQGRLSYRGDILASMDVGQVGSAQASVVGQLRFGQGSGLGLRTTYTGAINSTTFEAGAGSAQTYAIVAQAYYQLDLPLDGGRFNDQAGSRVQFTVGKMDFFGQFDQNAVAGDETGAFLNNVFVHNPLLDSGRDIGADTFGFAPGARLAWYHEAEKWTFGASVGAFASGGAATFGAGLGKPLVIAQLEASPKQINGEPRGSYRLYAWTNGRTTDIDSREQRHTGVGLSVDQRVGRDWNLFARAGKRTSGQASFNSAFTAGFELGGKAWGRSHDGVGLALGWLKTGDAWKAATLDTTREGYAASGSERLAELYYRVGLNDQFALTPSFQLIQNPAGNRGAPAIRVLGLRGTLSFGG